MKLKILAVSILLAFGSAQAQTANAEATELGSLQQTGVTEAWARGITGRGSIIGIIDNGFDLTHTDIKTQVIRAQNMSGGAVTWGTHGTQMASIAAGVKNNSGTVGVAPDAKVLLAQAGTGGTNLALDQHAIKLALDWLSSQGAHVINMSFGSVYDSAFLKTLRYDAVTRSYLGTTIVNTSADYALATGRGSVLVFSAGNQGLPFVQNPALYAVQTDARGQLTLGGRALIVGAVDSTNTIASYSNRAGHLCIQAIGASCRDTVQTMNYYVVAPGTAVQAATANQIRPGNTAGSVSGTSAAAAYVSGGMALLKQAWPMLRPEQLVNIVLFTARDLGTPGTDTTYGRGLVDFDRATNPVGRLAVAAPNYQLGQFVVNGAGVTKTGIGGGITLAFRSSSVLNQVQVIDEMGRNYTADFTRSMAGRQFSFDSQNPYLGFGGYTPINFTANGIDVTAFAGTAGSALELARDFGPIKLGYQFGTMQERSGYLGNVGAGAMDLGNSQTTWHTIGLERAITDSVSVQTRYSQGHTRVMNNNSSMIATLGPVTTDTWQLGLVSRDQFVEQDRLSFGVAGDIRIREGQARATAVTGYEFSESGDDIVARPIITSEVVNLRQQHQPVVWANYQRPITPNSLVRLGLSAGEAGYRAGVNFTWIQ